MYKECSESTTLLNSWQSIPGFDKIIEDMANNEISPLEEMNKLIFVSEIEKERLRLKGITNSTYRCIE